MHVLNKANDSVAVDSQNNVNAVATLAVPGVGFKWRVTAVSASYSGAAVAPGFRATLAFTGGVTIGRGVSTNDGWQQSFVNGMDGGDNQTVVLTLPAGGVGAVGDVAISAIKVPNTGVVTP